MQKQLILLVALVLALPALGQSVKGGKGSAPTTQTAEIGVQGRLAALERRFAALEMRASSLEKRADVEVEQPLAVLQSRIAGLEAEPQTGIPPEGARRSLPEPLKPFSAFATALGKPSMEDQIAVLERRLPALEQRATILEKHTDVHLVGVLGALQTRVTELEAQTRKQQARWGARRSLPEPLKPFAAFATALGKPGVQDYITALERRLPTLDQRIKLLEERVEVDLIQLLGTLHARVADLEAQVRSKRARNNKQDR